MKSVKKLLAALLCAALVLSATACNNGTTGSSVVAPSESAASSTAESSASSEAGSEESTPSETATGEEIELKFLTYLAGENVGAKFFLPQVERFNAQYAGQYKIVIEEVPQASYADKIKQLAQQNKLPALLHAPGSGGIDVQWFRTVAVPNGMAYDLTDAILNGPAKDVVISDSADFCTIDGKLVCMPLAVIRPVGLYYNSKLYSPETPIRDMDMDSFIASLGENKIAFQTVDNAWTTGLLLTGLIAEQPGGADLLLNNLEDRLYDYNDPAFVAAVGKLQTIIQQNGASNSIGAAYADAANAFMSDNAAVICNGPWMAAEFNADSSDKWSNEFNGADVRADFQPGNVAIASTRGFGDFWVSANADPAEIEVALAFINFRLSPEELEAFMLAEGGSAPNLDRSDAFLQELAKTQVLADLDAATTPETNYIPNVLEVFPSSIADVEFGKLLPKLADGTLTAEEFCQQLTEKAQDILS